MEDLQAPADLHSPENIALFARTVDQFEKHDRCGDYHLAIDCLRTAIHLCPFPSVGNLLEARLKSYTISNPFNLWMSILNCFSFKPSKMMGISKPGSTIRAWVMPEATDA